MSAEKSDSGSPLFAHKTRTHREGFFPLSLLVVRWRSSRWCPVSLSPWVLGLLGVVSCDPGHGLRVTPGWPQGPGQPKNHSTHSRPRKADATSPDEHGPQTFRPLKLRRAASVPLKSHPSSSEEFSTENIVSQSMNGCSSKRGP